MRLKSYPLWSMLTIVLLATRRADKGRLAQAYHHCKQRAWATSTIGFISVVLLIPNASKNVALLSAANTGGQPRPSVTGCATIFGLNWDGSVDTADNGRGFYDYNTRDASLIGVSLPASVIDKTIGMHDDPKIFVQIKSLAYVVKVMSQSGASIEAPIVDVGPAGWTGNAIDLTFGATRKLGLKDNCMVTYWIISSAHKSIPILGWVPSQRNSCLGAQDCADIGARAFCFVSEPGETPPITVCPNNGDLIR